MVKISKREYTSEFEDATVKRVKGAGESPLPDRNNLTCR